MRRLIGLVVLIGVAPLVGCAADMKDKAKDKDKKVSKREPGRNAAPEARQDGEAAGGEQAKDGAQKQDKAEKVQRKIIYTGDISLVVENFDRAEEKLTGLLALHDAYVAKSEVTGEPNTPRRGTWTVRVPVAKADDFRKEVVKLGELRRSTLDSRDITDEYYDTKAVITNLEAREAALRELYKQKIAGSRLSELLEVDRELTSVRTQINVRKGQIARWDKETEFTTFTLSIYDRRGYVPPESPEFSTRVGRTFHASLEAMRTFGEFLVLFFVAVAPWLVALAAVAVPLWLVLRRKAKAPPPVPVAVIAEEPPAPRHEESVTERG